MALGVIDEFDKGNLTFTLRRVEEDHPDQSCRIEESLFDDALEHFVNGTPVKVVGRRTRGSTSNLTVVALHPVKAPSAED